MLKALRTRLALRIALLVALCASLTVPLRAAFVLPGSIQTLNPNYSTIVGSNSGGTNLQVVGCTPNGDGITCSLNTTGGGGSSGAPLTGGASGVATAANQTVGLAAFNGTTMDALQDTSNALNVYVTNPAGGYSYTQNQTGSTGSFLGAACAYFLTPPTLTNSYVNPLYCDVKGNLLVNEAPATSSTITSVAASTSSTTLLAANTARRNFYVFNDSTAVMYLALAATASTSSYTTQIQPSQGYTYNDVVYNGAVSAVWASANGNARITEITP